MKPDSETAILRGAISIPISSFSIPLSGNSSQRAQEPIQGAPNAFLKSEHLIRDCQKAFRSHELPIPMQTAALQGSKVGHANPLNRLGQGRRGNGIEVAQAKAPDAVADVM